MKHHTIPTWWLVAWLCLGPWSVSGQERPPQADTGRLVRSMAEWEEVDYLLLTWTQHEPVLREIIRYARQECQVLIICMDADGVKQDLQAHGIPREGIDFLEHPFNSVWMRDYGPSTVYLNGVDSLVLVDWIYNRPRPIDDHLSRAIADHLGLPLLRMDTAPQDLVHIGGNFITDGNGTAFSSRLILAENGPQARYNQTPRDEGSIDTLMRRYLGIDRYLKLTPLPHDPIDHLDMHMKLLDEQRLLVGQYPTGVADGPQIEANLTYLQSALPQPYELIRVPMPAFHGHYPDTGHAPYLTYTNAVFVNRTLLVPTYDLPSDSLALDRYQKALPGYRVVGINCRPLIMAGGALHCVTRTIGTTAPLRIVHRPLADQEVDGLPQQVSASIDHRSGIKRAHLYYRLLGDSTFTPVPMIRVDDRSHQWVGYLPATYEPTTVSYYIEATAYSGKHQTRPMTAPAGYWQVQLTSPYDPPFPQRFSTSEPTW